MERKNTKFYPVIRMASHPLLFITSFLTLLVQDDSIDDVFLVMIFKGVTNDYPGSTLAIIGIFLLILSWIVFKRRLKFKLEAIMNVMGNLCFTAFIWLIIHSDNKPAFVIDARFSIPVILFNFFINIQSLHLVYNCFYRYYRWDELEMERRVKRNLFKKGLN